MIIKGTLEYLFPNCVARFVYLFCRLIFEPPHRRTNRGGGVSPTVSILKNKQQKMYMVWHNYITINRYFRIFIRHFLNPSIYNFAIARQFREGRPLPYNRRENVFSFFGTYGYKICTVCTIIKIFQACRFSFGKNFFLIHFYHSYHYNTKLFVGEAFRLQFSYLREGVPLPTIR